MTARKINTRFRSQKDGLWYVTPETAGTVDQVKIDDVIFKPEKQEEIKEKECSACGALNNVAEVEEYGHVFCHNCDIALEFVGNGLIPA